MPAFRSPSRRAPPRTRRYLCGDRLPAPPAALAPCIAAFLRSSVPSSAALESRPGRRRKRAAAWQARNRSASRQHDVAGLEIAMNNRCLMGAIERVSDLRAVFENIGERQRTPREALG